MLYMNLATKPGSDMRYGREPVVSVPVKIRVTHVNGIELPPDKRKAAEPKMLISEKPDDCISSQSREEWTFSNTMNYSHCFPKGCRDFRQRDSYPLSKNRTITDSMNYRSDKRGFSDFVSD